MACTRCWTSSLVIPDRDEPEKFSRKVQRAHRVHISSRPALPSSNKSVKWLKIDTMKTSEFISWTKPRLSRTIYRSRGVPWPKSGVMIFMIFTFFSVFFFEKSIHNNENVQKSDFFAPAGKLTGGWKFYENSTTIL